MSDISTLSEAYEMIFEVGRLVGKQTEAEDLIQEIQHNFEQIKPLLKRVLYFVCSKMRPKRFTSVLTSVTIDTLMYVA